MRKPSLHNNKQRGQAILLIAILMVALIAALGLAIDGGGMFLLYRDVQNATDAAGLSAAFAKCTGDNVDEAARYSAELNGFVHDPDPDIYPDVIVENPPTSGTYQDNEDYLRVTISAEKPSYFIRIVYDGPLRVSATTTAQCQPGSDFGFPQNSAIVTLNRHCLSQESLKTHGTGYLRVEGAVFVNQDCTSSRDSIKLNGTSLLVVEDAICTLGTTTGNQMAISNEATGDPALIYSDDPGDTACDYDPVELADPLGLGNMPNNQVCSTDHTGTTITNGNYSPGIYDGVNISPSGVVNLAPGNYCFNGDITIKGEMIGDDVFIYQNCTDCHWNMNAGGGPPGSGPNVQLTPPDSGEFKNLQVYSRSRRNSGPTGLSGTGNIWNGSTNLDIAGTVYIPEGDCSLTGSNGSNINAQFICYTMNFGGNTETAVNYLPGTTYQRPSSFGITE